MKCLAIFRLIGVISLAAANDGTAQSTFLFRNLDGTGPTRVDAPVFDAAGIPLAGAGYLAELYGGSELNSLTPLLALGPDTRLIKPFSLQGYVATGVGLDSMVLYTAPPGGSAWLQMRAWDAALGSTYEEAMARGMGGYGESSVFYADGGNPTLVPPEQPGHLIGLESFSLRAIPEPTSASLLILGSGLAWWFARRKRERGDTSRIHRL